jgi:hypothetical protein
MIKNSVLLTVVLGVFYVTTWNRILPEKLTVPQLVKMSTYFMQPKVSLPHSHQPATCPYPDQDQSSHCPIPLLEDPF